MLEYNVKSYSYQGEDLIGQILTAQHQRAIAGFGGGIQIYETPVQALLLFSPLPSMHPRESLLEGCMQVQECPKRPTTTLVTHFRAG